MKLVVGLGNPGRRYEQTRHNVGYAVAAELARRYAAGGVRTRFHGQLVEASIENQSVLVLCPETYMNLSGTSVQEAQGFYKIPLEDLLVVCDDLNLPLGKLRFRATGSSGGQKGMEDVIRRLGSEAIARLRIGIGQPPGGWNWADFVLSRFAKDEVPVMDQAVLQAADAVVDWVRLGISHCMNRHN